MGTSLARYLLPILAFLCPALAVDFDARLEGWWGVGEGDLAVAVRQAGPQLSMQAACLLFGRVPAGVNRVDNDRVAALMSYTNQSEAFFQFYEGFDAGCAGYFVSGEWIWMNLNATLCDSVYLCRDAQSTATVQVTTYTSVTVTDTVTSVVSATDTLTRSLLTTQTVSSSTSPTSSTSPSSPTSSTSSTSSSSQGTLTQSSPSNTLSGGVCQTARPSLCPQTAGDLFAVTAPAVSRKDAECICGRYPGGRLAVLSYLEMFSPAVQKEVLTCAGLAGSSGLWVGNGACKVAVWVPGGVQLVSVDCASKAAVLCRRVAKNAIVVEEAEQVCAFGSLKLYVQPLSAPNARLFCSVLQATVADVDATDLPVIQMLIDFCAKGQGEFWVNSVNGYQPASPMAARFSNGTFNYGFGIGSAGPGSGRMALCGQGQRQTLSSGPFPTSNLVTTSEFVPATSTVSVSTIQTVVSTVTTVTVTSVYSTVTTIA